MKPKHLIACLLFALFALGAQAQFKCGFDPLQQQLLESDPLYRESFQKIRTDIQRIIEAQKLEGKGQSTLAPIYYIPVVVHVVHTGGVVGTAYNPSDAQIQSALDYLNAVFDGTWTGAGGPILGAGDLNIAFVLANKNPEGSPTNGINRINGSAVANYTANGINALNATGATELSVKNLSRWDPYKFYNIWLVNKIDGCDGISGCPSFIAGYAYFPFFNAHVNTRDVDGTVMLASQMVAGEKTLPHEVAHSLNIYHPFHGESNVPGVNGCPANSAIAGDECADTNPVTNPADDGAPSPFACRTGTGCYGLNYSDNTEKNFMNYTNCYQLFTSDQRNRMQASLQATMRASLATSWANNQYHYPVTFTIPVPAVVTPVSTFVGNNAAGLMSISLNGQTIYSLNATQDGGYLNNAEKWHNLLVLEKSTTYTMTLNVLAQNNEQLGVWIDYNNDGAFNNTSEQLYYADNLPAGVNGVNFTFTTPASLSGTIVRLRVLEDVSTLYGVPAFNGSTSSLSYGQAEDYAVYLRAGVLPLNLTSFTGDNKNEKVNLKWTTSDELNTNRFEVERSMNGSEYRKVFQLPSKNAPGEHQYTTVDRLIQSGNYSYRLKMVDNDDRFKYSPILNFDVKLGDEVRVTGNPFSGQLQFLIPNSGGTMVRVLDATGRVLYHQSIATAGMHQISTAGWPSGTYLLQSERNGVRRINRLVKK